MVVAVPAAFVMVGPTANVVVPEGASQRVLVASPRVRTGMDDTPLPVNVRRIFFLSRGE
jgi:hypothetical protein